ncbi:MAG: membrane protein insertase YidC [Candidatus Aceula meridiana]|nr:membrane protein insertase YidC [Candidatus Aceula meridiana]
MEKRTIVAIIISLLILIGYQKVFVKPQVNVLKDMQVVEEEGVTESPAKKIQPAEEKIAFPLSSAVKKETRIFENDALVAEFSNIGGSLKSVTMKQYDETLPVQDIFGLSGYEQQPFVLKSSSNNKIIYSYTDESYEIKKIYDLSRQDYQIGLDVQVKNISGMSKVKSIKINALTIETTEAAKDKSLGRERGLYEYAVDLDGATTRKSNAFKFSLKNEEQKSGKVSWCSFRNRYFCTIVKPDFITKDYQSVFGGENRLSLLFETQNATIPAGASTSFQALAYIGPQNIKTMAAYGEGFEDVVAFSRFKILDFISKGIIKILNFVYKIVPNWGFAIIIVSILVYGAMYPLTLKGMMSMKKMQSLQPEIAKVREKHKSNPQKMNQEIMEMYKKDGVNPFGGCFPFLLQMPVFIGLYQALWRSVMFKGAGFLWIKDLSAPDRLFIFPFTLPVIGNELNILPLFMMVIMFFQQKFSSKNMVATDPNQIMQQKMMAIVFPLMLGFIFYKFASGLTLYFTMFYTFSMLSQWKMSKIKKVA